MKSSSQEIYRLAAEWATKRSSGILSPEDQARFEAWLAADVRHLGAYGRAAAVLARLDRLRAVGGDALRPASGPQTWSRRRVMVAGGTATGLAAAGLAGVLLQPRHTQAEFSTAIGETRVVALSDGSVVTLNTNSKVSVEYSHEKRDIHLLQGEALFNVAKNKQRPFIVSAGDTLVRAVGTSFTVRLLPQRPVQILVQEGTVEVMRRDARHEAPVRSVSDTQTLVPHDEPIVTRPVSYAQVTRGLAWQYGQIAFDNVTLRTAGEEFSRYSATRIIVDPAIADRTVTGMFASTDPVGFARAAAAALNLHLEVGPEEVRLIR